MATKAIPLTLIVGVATLVAVYAARGPLSSHSTPDARASAGLQACHALIDDFGDYPLLYLGDEFEGMPLTTCERAHTRPTNYGIPATDQVIFVYGTCTPIGGIDASCEPPLQVHVYPACMPAPVQAAGAPKATTRGVEASLLDRDEVFAEAPAFHVSISSGARDIETQSQTSQRAFAALIGVGPAAAGITAGAPLAAAHPVTPAQSPCS